MLHCAAALSNYNHNVSDIYGEREGNGPYARSGMGSTVIRPLAVFMNRL